MWLMLLPMLSFNASDIDSYVIVPALLLYVVSAGSNLPVLFAFRFETVVLEGVIKEGYVLKKVICVAV